MVDGRGQLLELDANDVRFPAAKLAIGALGIVTELTLRCEPAFTLTERLEQVPFDVACADLVEIARSAEYVKLWWLPHTDRVLVYRYHRGIQGKERTALARQVEETLLDGVVFDALLRIGAIFPALTPAINRLILPVAFPGGQQHGPADRMFTVAMPPRHFETESAIPLDRAGLALHALRTLIAAGRHRVNFIQELRFAPADDAWLSGAYGRDTCHFGTYIAGARPSDTAARDRYFRDVHAMLTDHEPRPHWGKALPEGAGLLQRYPRGEAFRRLADTLDPHHRFRHGMVARAFG
jgi:FAD/FMN-containing dehydrogenase